MATRVNLNNSLALSHIEFKFVMNLPWQNMHQQLILLLQQQGDPVETWVKSQYLLLITLY